MVSLNAAPQDCPETGLAPRARLDFVWLEKCFQKIKHCDDFANIMADLLNALVSYAIDVFPRKMVAVSGLHVPIIQRTSLSK